MSPEYCPTPTATYEEIVALTGYMGLNDVNNPVSDWRELALCAEIGEAIFFPEKGESAKGAKSVCSKCEVRQNCSDYALGRNEYDEHNEYIGV